jgi:hypothetical protein
VILPSSEISHWNRLNYVRILKNKLMELKKEQGDRTLWLSHGTCSYIRMYINAVADSVMLYLQRHFYNIIFKIKQIMCSFRVSPPPPTHPYPSEKIWVLACMILSSSHLLIGLASGLFYFRLPHHTSVCISRFFSPSQAGFHFYCRCFIARSAVT